MKRIFKSVLSIALVLIMAFSIVPFKGMITAQAAEIWQQPRGTIITYGSYPQSRVTNSTLISSLNSASSSYSWISYGYYTGSGNSADEEHHDGQMKPSDYMKYKDFKYNGSTYRAVTFTQYRPYYTGFASSADESFQHENGYYPNNVYYFKYEPLRWRILDPSEGLVMCENIIDSQAYNNYILEAHGEWYGDSEKTYYASNWAKSSLRAWLNDDFYNTAFSSSEKNAIKTSYLENKSTWSSSYDAPSTYDKVFLLSYWDMLNSNYRFSSSYSTYDTARRAQGTDYAKCQGLHVDRSSGSSYYGNSFWLLRSPYTSDSTRNVDPDGYVDDFDCSSGITAMGIRPALKFNPKSFLTDPCNVTLKKVGGKWYCYTDGKINYTYVGLAKNDYGWWYVKNGTIDFTYTGLAKNQYGWFYVKNGKLDTSYTGLAKNQYGWFYVKNGKLDTSYTGLAKNQYGWFYVKNGKLDTSYTGLAKNQYGWFYVKNGKLDISYTGLAKNQYGWWYVKNGKLDTTYTGYAQNEYGWWYVRNGKVVN